MYFKNIPTIVYDSVGDGQFKDVKNLLRRVSIRAKVKANTLFYDTYDVKEGERPEDIAFKYYGDPQYHWVVMMVNNLTDRYYQWPMTQPDFEDFLTDKYGAGSEDAVHHYELAQTSGATSSIDESHMLEVNSDTDNATSISNRQFEERQQDKFRQIRLLDEKYLDSFTEEFFALIRKNRF